jgi:hypothetical protein
MADAGLRSEIELPRAPTLASAGVFGATAIFTALAIGAGELMFWPSLVLANGAGILWLALIIVLLQWVINIEVARFSLGTGLAMGEGAARASKLVGILLLLGAIVPWIWPGWVRSGGQLLAGLTGFPERTISLVSILACALLMSLPPLIYPLAEKLQSIMLAMILIGVAVLFGYVASVDGGFGSFLSEFATLQGMSAAANTFAQTSGNEYYALLGGVVFAGAGGILNLGYGLLLADKGAGMGAFQPRLHGIAQAARQAPQRQDLAMAPTETNRSEWKRWIGLARREHFILFAGGNGASIIFLSAIFYMIYAGGAASASGISLLVNTFELLGARYGAWAGVLFAIVGFLVFFTSALGILHVTSRIAAGIAATLFGGATNRWFHIFIWGQFAASSLLIMFDPRQPFWLLVTSAVLNTLVMAIYSFTVLWLNRRSLPDFARAPIWVEAVVALGGTAFGLVFLWTVYVTLT